MREIKVDIFRGWNGRTASKIFARASASVIIANHFDWQLEIGNRQFRSILSARVPVRLGLLVRWLSGRKQRFAKAPYPKRVPRVRIPPSPSLKRGEGTQKAGTLSDP